MIDCDPDNESIRCQGWGPAKPKKTLRTVHEDITQLQHHCMCMVLNNTLLLGLSAQVHYSSTAVHYSSIDQTTHLCQQVLMQATQKGHELSS